MLADANVTKIELDCRLLSATRTDLAPGVSGVGSINLFCEKEPISATVFIDASYDGEIMVSVGDVEYTAGREAISQYNESLAGARVPGWTGVGGPKGVNALKDDGTIIKYVANISELAAPGEADDALMAFQHRMCISGDDDRIPWPKPDGYDRDDFLLIQRALDANHGDPSFFTHLPPSTLPGYPGSKKKYCLCCGITVGATDQPMLNSGCVACAGCSEAVVFAHLRSIPRIIRWANATWEQKQEIIAEHTYFELGTFYYLANDEQVPESVREQFSSYGTIAWPVSQ